MPQIRRTSSAVLGVHPAVMGERRRRFTITAEVTVEVTDVATLRKAALDRVAEAGFVAGGDRSVEQVRSDELRAVDADLAATFGWVTDADAIVEAGVGVEVIGSDMSVAEGEDAGVGSADFEQRPDFAALFPTCDCGRTIARTALASS
jgi:hypothetical protein